MIELQKNRTTIIIAHRLSTIESVDRVIYMEKGKITESGTHKELLNMQGRYFKMYMSLIEDQPHDI